MSSVAVVGPVASCSQAISSTVAVVACSQAISSTVAVVACFQAISSAVAVACSQAISVPVLWLSFDAHPKQDQVKRYSRL